MVSPVVLRFASVRPAALSRIRMHARRSAGDLDHIAPALASVPVELRNPVLVGGAPPDDDWVERFHAEAKAAALGNREAKAKAAEERGQHKEASRIRSKPPTKPYREGKGGPLREGILTASAEWFNAEAGRFAAFEKAGRAFLKKHFGGSLLHVRLDIDEEAPHFHFVVAPWVEETTKGGAKVKVLRPRSNPLFASYEAAQDAAGEHFKAIGLKRGQKRRDILRLAKEAGIEPPPKRWHKTPSAYRADQRQREQIADLAVRGALEIKKEALEEGAALAKAAADTLAAGNAELARKAKIVMADSVRIVSPISADTKAVAEYVADPSSSAGRAALEKAAAVKEAAKAKGEALRQAAAKKAVVKELMKQRQRQR